MIDLEIGQEGITPEWADKAARIPPIPAATYEFALDRIDEGNTMDGRPRWGVYLRVINDPKYPNRTLYYGCVLPWINPSTGQWDVSGIGFLTNLKDGVGVPWQGDLRSPEVQQNYKMALGGAVGFMRVGQRPNRDDPSVMDNTVRIVVAKRKK